MSVSLAIGINSSGLENKVSLTELPHLFISYSYNAQLLEIFYDLIAQTQIFTLECKFSFCLGSKISKKIKPLINPENTYSYFFHGDEEEGEINSAETFIEHLSQEIKRRKKILKGEKSKELLEILIVFIDDFFEIIISPKKKKAALFIQLLIESASLNVHFIIASSRIYKPLLAQLIRISNYPITAVQANTNHLSLGAELVINPDGMLFFKAISDNQYLSLYPNSTPRLI